MPSCVVQIELDRTTVPAGESVTGTIVVEVDAAVSCDELTVCLSWVRHGRIARRAELVAAETVYAGAWAPGQHRLPFSLPVPPGPLTAATDVLMVDWEVTATASVGHAGEPAACAPLTVVRHPSRPDQRADTGQAPPEVLSQQAGGYVLGLLFAGLGGAVAYVAGLLFFGGLAPAGIGLLIGLAFAALGIQQIWSQFTAGRRRARLATFSVGVPEGWVGPGTRLELPVTVASRRPEQLLGVSVSLVHQTEVTVRRPNQDTERIGSRVTVDEAEVWAAVGVSPGRTATATVVLTLPPDAAPSFYWQGCAMEWRVVLEAAFGDTRESVSEDVRLRVG